MTILSSTDFSAIFDSPSVFLGTVLALGAFAQWIAWKLGLPSILMLLGFGVLAGLFFTPDDFIPGDLLFPAVSLAVGIILFEGGLSLRLKEFREAGRPVIRLCTIGVLVTWVLASIAAYYLLNLDTRICLLLGAVLTVTGPTVIIPLLRHIRPRKRVGAVAKWEGIVIDPVGAVLAVLVFQAAFTSNPEDAVSDTVISLLMTIAVGLGLAYAFGKGLEIMLRRHLIPDFLHGTVILGGAVAAFTISNAMQHESGLLTVTALGIYLANRKGLSVKHVIEFKENLRVLLIAVLFIVLAARIDLQDFATLGWRPIFFLVVLILIIRPVSVIISLMGTKLSRQERIFLALLAPRGIVAAAVTSLFAIELMEKAAADEISATLGQQAEQLVPLIFMVIIGTVAFYGFVAGIAARKLKLAVENPQGILFAGVSDWVIQAGKHLQDEECQVLVVDTNYEKLSAARMVGLTTQRASIVSEYTVEEMDLAGLGRLIALTPNDEVNSLGCQEFRQEFGTANVFQLTPRDNDSSHRVTTSEHLRGRYPFSSAPTFDEIEELITRGATVKKSVFTENFKLTEFRERYGDDAIILFVVHENKTFDVFTDDMKLKDGDKLISLVFENDSSKPSTSAEVTGSKENEK